MAPERSEASQAIIDKMDAAAAVAAKSIPITGSAKDLADWLAKNYMAAGYKRLAKLILQAFGK